MNFEMRCCEYSSGGRLRLHLSRVRVAVRLRRNRNSNRCYRCRTRARRCTRNRKKSLPRWRAPSKCDAIFINILPVSLCGQCQSMLMNRRWLKYAPHRLMWSLADSMHRVSNWIYQILTTLFGQKTQDILYRNNTSNMLTTEYLILQFIVAFDVPIELKRENSCESLKIDFPRFLEWKCSRLNFYWVDSTKSRRRGVERRILTTHPHTHTRARTILKINDFLQRLLRTVRCTRFNDGDEHKVVSFTKEAP